MADNTHKEEWINGVMKSTQGISRATPPSGLTEKVLAGVNSPAGNRIIVIPLKQWAAAAIILLAMNIGSVVYFTSQDKRAGNGNEQSGLTGDIQIETTYNY